MARAPIGQRIRKRRQELALSQTELANRAGISPSYLNLIEHNKRSIGGALLHRIAAAIELDSRALAGTEEARLIAELAEVADDSALQGVEFGPDDARDIVATNPQAARAILAFYRAYREARVRSDLIGERLGEESFLADSSQQILALITTIRSYSEILGDYGDLSDAERRRFVSTLIGESETLAARAGDMFDYMSGRGARRPRASPREEIEDFISDHANYFPHLEAAAEEMLANLPGGSPTVEVLVDRLRLGHGISVERGQPTSLPPGGETREGDVFRLADNLGRTSARFRLARLLCTLEYGGILEDLVTNAALSSVDAAARLSNALASYFAAALIMPYAPFLAATEEFRFDIMRIGQRFDASFEQVCHRLTNLRRPGAESIPMHFLRTDIAGNISKRFSASGLRLPRYGGACPRWIIHQSFTLPGRIVTQIGRLPDGEAFFCVARAEPPNGSTDMNPNHHAVMIGCAMEHARRFAYADGLDLTAAPVPIGVTCRQCAHDDCGYRAFDRISEPGAPSPVPVT